MRKLWFFAVVLFLVSCSSKQTKLPFYSMSIVNSPLGPDTIFNPLPEFEFTNQMGKTVNNETFKGKAFVADFFFTSCPGICPKMTRNMLKVYDAFPNDELMFLSHSVDPKRDTVQKLRSYAEKIGINSDERWNFVTGPKEDISRMAETYMVIAYEDSTVSGGFEHGGQFILVDKNQFVRGFYVGTDEESVDKLIADLKLLLEEE